MYNKLTMPQREKMTLAEAREIRRNYALLAAASSVYVLVGVWFMMRLESLDFIDSLYFSVISLTTIGFGDITPQTTEGKIFVMIYVVFGIAIIAGLFNTVFRSAVATRVIRQSKK